MFPGLFHQFFHGLFDREIPGNLNEIGGHDTAHFFLRERLEQGDILSGGILYKGSQGISGSSVKRLQIRGRLV